MTRCALSLVKYVMRYRSPVQHPCCVTRALGEVPHRDSFNSSLCFSGCEALDTHLPAAPYLDHSLDAHTALQYKTQEVKKTYHGHSIQPRDLRGC
jgi:hypothetical protein